MIGPKILGEHTGVSSFWVLFSILLFGGLWGLVGMIIAVPLFAVLYDLVKRLVYRGLTRNGCEEELEAYNTLYHPPQESDAEQVSGEQCVAEEVPEEQDAAQ